MEVKAAHRFAKISPRKARLVIDLIRGVSVDEALNRLRLAGRRASPMVAKVLRSAVATAAEREDLEPEDLVVARAWVDAGPMRYTWWARPRGATARKRHRTSHIHVVIATPEAPEAEEPEDD